MLDIWWAKHKVPNFITKFMKWKHHTCTVACIHTLANLAKRSVSWDCVWASLGEVIPWGQCAAFRFWLMEFTVEQTQNQPARYRQQLVCPGSVTVSTGSTDLGSTCSAWTQTLSLWVCRWRAIRSDSHSRTLELSPCKHQESADAITMAGTASPSANILHLSH